MREVLIGKKYRIRYKEVDCEKAVGCTEYCSEHNPNVNKVTSKSNNWVVLDECNKYQLNDEGQIKNSLSVIKEPDVSITGHKTATLYGEKNMMYQYLIKNPNQNLK